jgi:hypothetical protein
MKKTTDREYEASLKSIETENFLDRRFYRPIGFRIACALRHTRITPNMVTILSIFVGASVGPLFYCNSLWLNLLGVWTLILANILDCVDGQLARLTGIKSKIGRILDGLAGDIWFLLIYFFLALRLNHQYDTSLFFIPAVLSALSHLLQANITDYYKTLHLYFVDQEKGSEFQQSGHLRAQHQAMKPGLEKALYFLYLEYTTLQERMTPRLQAFLRVMHERSGDDIPDNIRRTFRRNSAGLMKRWIDWMTFNGRSLILFISIPAGSPWFYFFYEIIVLNIILCIAIRKHERLCSGYLFERQGETNEENRFRH